MVQKKERMHEEVKVMSQLRLSFLLCPTPSRKYLSCILLTMICSGQLEKLALKQVSKTHVQLCNTSNLVGVESNHKDPLLNFVESHGTSWISPVISLSLSPSTMMRHACIHGSHCWTTATCTHLSGPGHHNSSAPTEHLSIRSKKEKKDHANIFIWIISFSKGIWFPKTQPTTTNVQATLLPSLSYQSSLPLLCYLRGQTQLVSAKLEPCNVWR